MRYQPSHDTSPITNKYETFRLNALTDVECLDRSYARDHGLDIRNHSMFVSGTEDWPQDHWDGAKIPFTLTAESLRSRSADKALNNHESLYPGQTITSLVGHA